MDCIYCYGQFKNGLHPVEVEMYFKDRYGKKHKSVLNKFKKFMGGQTMGICVVDQKSLYYRHDVQNFIEQYEKNPKKRNYRVWD